MVLFFDLDGTIANTLQDLSACTNATLTAFGFPEHPLSSYGKMVGSGLKTLLVRALPQEIKQKNKNDEILLAKMLEFLLKYYSEHLLDYTAPYVGILPLLQKLVKEGHVLYVHTNKPQKQAQEIAQALFPNLFKGIYGQGECYPIKPDASIVRSLCKQEGVLPKDCFYIGDSDVDVFTAKNAGMPVIGCCWGFRGENELKESGADFIAQKAEDIDAIVHLKYRSGGMNYVL